MKRYHFIFIFALIGCSSGSDDEILDEPEMMEKGMEEKEEVEVEEGGLLGTFVSDEHVTTGTATVNMEKTILSFTNFKTDTGPKLLIYLSTTKNSTDYVDLGDIKGVNGNYTYTIPENTDLSKYKIVSVWCVDFSVSFGHAELK
jgi:hypothetical protein